MRKFESLTKYLSQLSDDSFGTWIVDRENDGTPEHPIQMPYHILSTPDKEEAIAARQEIVRLRTESGDDAAVEYLEQQKEARKAERRELMKQYGGFPTREEMAEMKQQK